MSRNSVAATARVTSKGQVTIPKEVRDELGVKAGSTIRFEGTRSAMRVAPAAEPASFTKYVGWGLPGVPKGMTGIEWVRSIRGGDDRLD